MTYREIMKELEALGTAQNRKVYRRHGAGENLFGVSFGTRRHSWSTADAPVADPVLAVGHGQMGDAGSAFYPHQE